MKSLFLGVDPGDSGGLALVRHDYAVAWKIPDTEADTADLLRTHAPQIHMAYIERVQAFPTIPRPGGKSGGQGVSSAFKFGQSYGFFRGLLIALQIPFEQIEPRVWQQRMGCRTHGDKNVSKAKAQQLWPQLRITHAIADALLIAECCRRFHSAILTPNEIREREGMPPIPPDDQDPFVRVGGLFT